MSNIRILAQNVALDSASIVTSTSSGSLVAANLLLPKKSSAWRATAKTGTITLTWTTAVTVNAAILAFTNFSATATMQAQGYTNVADVVAAIDSGAVLCCAATPRNVYGFGTQPLDVNAFSYGGGAYARVFFSDTLIKKLVLTISDTSNANNISAANLVVGQYWSPAVNPDFGAAMGVAYAAKHGLTVAGDLTTEIMPQNKTMKFEFGWLASASDQQKAFDLLTGNGMVRPMYINLFPEDADAAKEQRGQIYAKLSGDSSMAHPRYGSFALPLDLKEV